MWFTKGSNFSKSQGVRGFATLAAFIDWSSGHGTLEIVRTHLSGHRTYSGHEVEEGGGHCCSVCQMAVCLEVALVFWLADLSNTWFI